MVEPTQQALAAPAAVRGSALVLSLIAFLMIFLGAQEFVLGKITGQQTLSGSLQYLGYAGLLLVCAQGLSHRKLWGLYLARLACLVSLIRLVGIAFTAWRQAAASGNPGEAIPPIFLSILLALPFLAIFLRLSTSAVGRWFREPR